MAKTSLGQNSPGGNNPPMAIHLPMREQTTANQINSLLSIVGMTLAALGTSIRDREDLESAIPPATEGRRLPGEAIVAAENTFINTLARIDKMLADDCRWGMDFQNRIEADYDRAIKANQDFLDAQAKAAKSVAAPHNHLHPKLAKLNDGNWAVITGELDSSTSIIGIGRTPEEAYESYDAMFNGIVTPFAAQWFEKHGIELSKLENDQNSLDSNGRTNPKDPPSGGQDGSSDSGGHEPPLDPSDG